MKSSSKKDLATSLTTFFFLAIGITGILMFFHIFDKFTKDIHEILGLVFVLIVLFHIFYNFKSMKNYFKKNTFLLSGSIIFAICLGFIINASMQEGENPKRVIITSVLKAPIEKSFALFKNDFQTSKDILEKNGIKIEEGKSIKELASLNKTSPFRIVDLLVK